METGKINLSGAEIKFSFLKDKNDQWMQMWYTVIPQKPEPILTQIKTIENAEEELFNKFGIKPETIAIKKLFSSDLITQKTEIINYKQRQKTDFYLSVTEQTPASNVKLVLLGMCLNNITGKFREGNVFHFDTTSDITHIFIEHIVDSEADEHTDSEKQTQKIFNFLKAKLSEFQATIEDNVLRTWIYTPNVDADYPGIVKARKELFDAINLTKDTHYIASTGIQGGAGDRFARVFMDAYAVTGITQEKIRYIQAPEYLSPTHIYGVTFERATAIKMGNTDFLFISGTASIDNKGDVVFPGDVENQTRRTLENISALLESAGFIKENLSGFIVYLRDIADYGFTKPIIEQYLENLPTIYVKAPVCRPGWLIEIEATAAKYID